MLFRDYYRKDTPDKIKGLIEEIVTERGKTIPPTPELEKRIGKFEKEFDKLTEQSRALWQSMIKAEREFNRVSKILPPTAPEVVAARTEMDTVKKAWRTGGKKIDIAQKGLGVQEKENLKDLW
jgi:chromosome segregation ATPase